MPNIPEISGGPDLVQAAAELLARCRRHAPVVGLTSPKPTRNGYVVTRYGDIATARRDPTTVSSIGNPL